MYSLIKKYEGFRATAYKCPAGIWTIGYGSTSDENGSIKEGSKITQEDAEVLIDWWVVNNCSFIDLMELTPNQKEAVISLVYNIGATAFKKSSLYKAILEKDYKTIIHNWDWISGGGRVLKGLVKRRTEELALFCQDI